MLTFRIKVPGHGEYTGIFASAAAARISAQALYPAAQPASVFCLSRMGRASWSHPHAVATTRMDMALRQRRKQKRGAP